MKSIVYKFIPLLLVCALLLSAVACVKDYPAEDVVPEELQTTQEEPQTIENGAMLSTHDLALDLREMFADTEKVVYQESRWGLQADHEFFIDLEFDLINDTDIETIYDIYAVFADADLTEPLWVDWNIITNESYDFIPPGHNRLLIRPAGSVPIGRVFSQYIDIIAGETVMLGNRNDMFLHEGKWGDTWGYLSHFYLALFVDPITAEPLDKPLVTIFTLENQLEAPQSEFFISDEGLGGFRWNAVENAEYYLIAKVDENLTTETVVWPIAKATETTWTHPEMLAMNLYFHTEYERDENVNFTVIAVNDETHSPIGNLHNGAVIASRLVVQPAFELIDEGAEETGVDFVWAPSIGLLPMQLPLVMADGSIVNRRMIYDLDNVYYTEEPNPLNDDEIVYVIKINYTVEGTTFENAMFVENVDPTTFEEELEAFKERLDEFESRGGGARNIEIIKHDKSDETPTPDKATKAVATNDGDKIYANSALSAFLAFNMLSGNELIDLTDFPESASWELLVDAFFEAMYQNPLIMHVAGAGTLPGTNVLVIEYQEPAVLILSQQNAVRRVVPQIISSIITGGMTDLEKSIAINQYLVDTARYDWLALENAGEHNFQHVDPIFNDSFTAYGILINNVGVCAGYAAAFKLLADEAGLESIVVTGYLEGYLPHAWNRVNINGQWHIIDVTNNDNEFLYNIFLHLPDKVAGKVLVEDGNYIISEFFGTHRSATSADEYYHVTGRFFDRNSIAAELATLMQETGSANLRTDFNLDDDTFFAIVQEVAGLTGNDVIYGFHLLGAIFLTDGR